MAPPNTDLLLIDAHPSFRDLLRLILSNQSSLRIVGEAGDGPQAVALVGQRRPDVVVMDIGLGSPDGLETTRRIRTCFAQVQVVILTTYEEQAYLLEALQAGAAGYVLKRSVVKDLLAAVEAVAAGRVYVSPLLAESPKSRLRRPVPLTPVRRAVGG